MFRIQRFLQVFGRGGLRHEAPSGLRHEAPSVEADASPTESLLDGAPFVGQKLDLLDAVPAHTNPATSMIGRRD